MYDLFAYLLEHQQPLAILWQENPDKKNKLQLPNWIRDDAKKYSILYLL